MDRELHTPTPCHSVTLPPLPDFPIDTLHSVVHLLELKNNIDMSSLTIGPSLGFTLCIVEFNGF